MRCRFFCVCPGLVIRSAIKVRLAVQQPLASIHILDFRCWQLASSLHPYDGPPRPAGVTFVDMSFRSFSLLKSKSAP